MKTRFRHTVAVILTSVSLAVLNVLPVWAADSKASTAHASMTFEFPDVVFDASGDCINPSFNVDVKASISSTDWFVDITMRKEGQSPTGSEGRAMGTNTGPAVGTIQICPNIDGDGAYIINGMFTTFDNATNASLETSFVSSVTVRKGKSDLVLNSLKRSGSKISLTGKVTGLSEKFGNVGLVGPVRVDYQLKNSGKWLALTEVYSDKSGNFKVGVVKKLPKKITFRVTFVETGSMESSEVKKIA